jgi:hypothetical protein
MELSAKKQRLANKLISKHESKNDFYMDSSEDEAVKRQEMRLKLLTNSYNVLPSMFAVYKYAVTIPQTTSETIRKEIVHSVLGTGFVYNGGGHLYLFQKEEDVEDAIELRNQKYDINIFFMLGVLVTNTNTFTLIKKKSEVEDTNVESEKEVVDSELETFIQELFDFSAHRSGFAKNGSYFYDPRFQTEGGVHITLHGSSHSVYSLPRGLLVKCIGRRWIFKHGTEAQFDDSMDWNKNLNFVFDPRERCVYSVTSCETSTKAKLGFHDCQLSQGTTVVEDSQHLLTVSANGIEKKILLEHVYVPIKEEPVRHSNSENLHAFYSVNQHGHLFKDYESIRSNNVSVVAKKLAPVELFGNNVKYPVDDSLNKRCTTRMFHQSMPLSDWVIVLPEQFLSDIGGSKQVDNFVQSLRIANTNQYISKPKTTYYADYWDKIPKSSVALVVLEDSSKELQMRAKRTCDQQKIISHFVSMDDVKSVDTQKSNSTMIALALKVGAVPWVILANQQTLVVGLSRHDTKLGFCASMGKETFNRVISIEDKEGVENCFVDAINHYSVDLRLPPQALFVYVNVEELQFDDESEMTVLATKATHKLKNMYPAISLNVILVFQTTDDLLWHTDI